MKKQVWIVTEEEESNVVFVRSVHATRESALKEAKKLVAKQHRFIERLKKNPEWSNEEPESWERQKLKPRGKNTWSNVYDERGGDSVRIKAWPLKTEKS